MVDRMKQMKTDNRFLILRALTSGSGVALALLLGASGPLIGVAISASLLPPVVNCVSIIFVHFFKSSDISNIIENSGYSVPIVISDSCFVVVIFCSFLPQMNHFLQVHCQP